MAFTASFHPIFWICWSWFVDCMVLGVDILWCEDLCTWLHEQWSVTWANNLKSTVGTPHFYSFSFTLLFSFFFIVEMVNFLCVLQQEPLSWSIDSGCAVCVSTVWKPKKQAIIMPVLCATAQWAEDKASVSAFMTAKNSLWNVTVFWNTTQVLYCCS